MDTQTIAAISTPAGEGGIGIVRVSGSKAYEVADKVFRSAGGKRLAEIPGYTALFGAVYDGQERLDTAVALKFKGPKSYTGEDVIELSIHGGSRVLTRLLRAVLGAGARLAEPGEFTRRAFLNGKMDLTQAESVMQLIHARSDSELRMANAASMGLLSRDIEKLLDVLSELAASIAVFSDYPEEDLPQLDNGIFRKKLLTCQQALNEKLSRYDTGRMITEGIDTAIVGRPNVGKSTLMNLITGATRSLVTDIAGTTRDVIEDTVRFGGTILRLADTAGIHNTDEPIEQMGVDLAKARIGTADLVLAVFDTSRKPNTEDEQLIESLQGKTVIAVLNKSDCRAYDYNPLVSAFPTVAVSAREGTGLKELEKTIGQVVGTAGFDPSGATLLGERQRYAAVTALSSIEEAIKTLDSGFTIDAVGVCVDDAMQALCELIGKRVTTEVADQVFRHFCVGK